MTKAMRWATDHRARLGLLAALLLPLSIAALLVPFRATFTDAAASLVLVAVVTLVAVLGTRSAGYVSALSASLWFDFFLTRPYEQIVITHRADIEITVSLFVVGVLITELAVRNRNHHETSKEEASYIELIYRMSELASFGAPYDEVVSTVSAELVTLLHLRACRFELGVPKQPIISQMGRDGRVQLGAIDWPVPTWGLPGSEVSLTVITHGQPVGRFVLIPTPGQGVSLQRRLVALAIVDQVGPLLIPRLRSA